MNEEQFKVIEDYLCVKMPREVDHHNAGAAEELQRLPVPYGRYLPDPVCGLRGVSVLRRRTEARQR